MREMDLGLFGAGLALALLTLAAGPASAQASADGPLSTATGAAPPPASAPPSALPETAAYEPDQTEPPARDGKIHGMVEAAIGTNGYRHGAAAIDAPLPDGGEVAIAAESTQIQASRGRKAEHLAATAAD